MAREMEPSSSSSDENREQEAAARGEPGEAPPPDSRETAAAIETAGSEGTTLAPATAILPQREDSRALTVVGLGGSAGSIPALEAFFQSISGPDTLSAYVVVLHLSPEYESRLAELLSRSTTLPVRQVTEPVKVEPGHVYVIAPGKSLEMSDGMLRLRDLKPGNSGTRVTIDTFFRTLADAHGPQAAAVVLSGTGADGTLGIRQIKEVGGLTVAQSPGEAEYDAMPRSAIATGMVDYVLPVSAMPAQIAAYWETSRRMRLPEEAAPSPEQREEGPDQEAALREILAHVRAQTGHGFALYKRATVLRRTGRRMQVNGLESLTEYLDFLRSHPAEVGDLVSDLLISVTQFFRDPEAWAALERDVIPRLLRVDQRRQWEEDSRSSTAAAGAPAEVRAWVCGCATGEEAYTLAMLLLEAAGATGPPPPRIQVFATDMDADAIARARTGIYPDTIAVDVSEERLRRWFYRHNNGQNSAGNNSGSYQVRQELREAVLFATHDVLRDTPFSRLDLITCRNLMIYLNREAQEQVFGTFHFALRPDGRLMLGPSESADSAAGLFGVTDKPNRLYVRRPVARVAGGGGSGGIPPLPSLLSSVDSAAAVPTGESSGSATHRARGRDPLAAGTTLGAAFPPLPSSLLPAPQRPVNGGRELLLSLMERYGPPTALIDEEHEIIHLSGGAGRFLRFSDGEPTRNLLLLVRPDLRIELRAALFTARAEGADQVRLIRAARLAEAGSSSAAASLLATPVRLTVRPVIDAPESAHGYFLVQFEELPPAAAAAEVTDSGISGGGGSASSVPSVEETSEENARGEEAAAPTAAAAAAAAAAQDAELARRLEEENATLQRQLRSTIEQYEAITEELKASNEELQAMNEEQRSAAEELETSKEELQSVNEELSTVNHELKARVDEVSHANSDLQNFLSSTHIATLFLDRELRVKRYTPAAEALFNLIPTDVGRPLAHITHQLDYPTLHEDAESVLARLTPVEREIASATDRAAAESNSSAARRHFLARLLPYRSLDDRIDGVVINFVDLTERRQAEEGLRASEEQFRRAIEDAPLPVIMHAEDGEVLQISRTWTELTGYTLADVPTVDAWLTRAYGEGADAVRRHMHELFEGERRSLDVEFTVQTRHNTLRYWSFSASSPGTLRDGRRFIVGMALDITERRQAEQALRQSEERFRLLVEGAQDYAMFLLDTENRITFWSAGAERIFGWSEQEALGQSGNLIFTPEDREQDAPQQEIQAALAQGSADDRRWHLRKDGSRFWADGLLMRLTSSSSASSASSDRNDSDKALELVGFAKVTRDATDQKRAEEALRASEEALRQANETLEARVAERTRDLSAAMESLELNLQERQQLLDRIVTAQEEERRRLSRELHDQTGQHLAALMLGCTAFQRDLAESGALPTDSPLLSRISDMHARLGSLAQDLHHMAVELRPTSLDDLGLEAVLANYVSEWSRYHQIAAEFDSSQGMEHGEQQRLPAAVETALYRITQEALTNRLKACPGSHTGQHPPGAATRGRTGAADHRGQRRGLRSGDAAGEVSARRK